jgi:hypothetical protein
VLFTLFVNGTTLRFAIRLLGLDRLSARDAPIPKSTRREAHPIWPSVS